MSDSKLEKLLQSKAELDAELAEEQKKVDRLEADRAAAECRRVAAERQAEKDLNLFTSTNELIDSIKKAVGKNINDPSTQFVVAHLLYSGIDEGGSRTIKGGIMAI